MAKETQNRRQQRDQRRSDRRNGKTSRHGNVYTLPTADMFPPEECANLITEFRPRKPAQEQYAMLIRNNIVTFGIGAAGCGKSFVGIALASLDIQAKKARKLVIVRPVVEAKGGGPGLGFLPGTEAQKVEPYLRPVKEIMAKFFSPGHLEYLFSHEGAEFATIEHMRGRTFDDCYIIVDEAQNITKEQMLLVLTRIGHNCKVVINGDTKQNDLASARHISGLMDAVERLRGKDNFGVHIFTKNDVVRHGIVQTVIEAYEAD